MAAAGWRCEGGDNQAAQGLGRREHAVQETGGRPVLGQCNPQGAVGGAERSETGFRRQPRRAAQPCVALQLCLPGWRCRNGTRGAGSRRFTSSPADRGRTPTARTSTAGSGTSSSTVKPSRRCWRIKCSASSTGVGTTKDARIHRYLPPNFDPFIMRVCGGWVGLVDGWPLWRLSRPRAHLRWDRGIFQAFLPPEARCTRCRGASKAGQWAKQDKLCGKAGQRIRAERSEGGAANACASFSGMLALEKPTSSSAAATRLLSFGTSSRASAPGPSPPLTPPRNSA